MTGQCAEHEAEDRMPPGCLRERARVRKQRRDPARAAGRVAAVDDVAEGVERDVLEERHAECQPPSVRRRARSDVPG